MKFKMVPTVPFRKGAAIYQLRSKTGKYEIMRSTDDTRPQYNTVWMRWKSKSGKSKRGRQYQSIHPEFRIMDGQEMTGIFLVRELLSFLHYIPETVGVYSLRFMLRSIADNYGGVAGEGTRPRCEITVQKLHKKKLFATPREVKNLLKEAGLSEKSPSG